MRERNSLVLGGKTLIFQDCKIQSPMNNSEALAVTDFVCRHWQHPQKMRNCGADKPSTTQFPKNSFCSNPWAPQWLVCCSHQLFPTRTGCGSLRSP